MPKCTTQIHETLAQSASMTHDVYSPCTRRHYTPQRAYVLYEKMHDVWNGLKMVAKSNKHVNNGTWRHEDDVLGCPTKRSSNSCSGAALHEDHHQGEGRKLRIIYKSGVAGGGRVLLTRWGWKFLLVIYFWGAGGHNNVGGTKIRRSIKRQAAIVIEDFRKTVKDKFKTWKHYLY